MGRVRRACAGASFPADGGCTAPSRAVAREHFRVRVHAESRSLRDTDFRLAEKTGIQTRLRPKVEELKARLRRERCNQVQRCYCARAKVRRMRREAGAEPGHFDKLADPADLGDRGLRI